MGGGGGGGDVFEHEVSKRSVSLPEAGCETKESNKKKKRRDLPGNGDVLIKM